MYSQLINNTTKLAQRNAFRQWARHVFIEEERTNRFLPKKDYYLNYCQFVGEDIPAYTVRQWTKELADYCSFMDLQLNPLLIKGTKAGATTNRCILSTRGKPLEYIYILDNIKVVPFEHYRIK